MYLALDFYAKKEVLKKSVKVYVDTDLPFNSHAKIINFKDGHWGVSLWPTKFLGTKNGL